MIVDKYMPQIVYEIVYTVPSKYDTIIMVAKKILWGSIIKYCNSNPYLRNKGYEEDILQQINLRIYKYVKRDFFCCVEGTVNDNPRQLTSWMFTLAFNEMHSFAKKHGGYESNNVLSDEVKEHFGTAVYEYMDATRETLQNVFDRILSSNVSIYKILTWIAMYLVVLRYCEKKDSVRTIESVFDSLTLDEMYDLLKGVAGNIPWLTITEAQDKKIRSKLDKIHKSGKRYGDIRYNELYMKKGAKSTISDWINRMNDYLDD